MKDSVTNNQLYVAIMDIHKKIDDVVDKRITPLELWRAEIMGKITIVMGVLIVTLNFLTDWVKAKFLRTV